MSAKKIILVIDDEKEMQELIKLYLSDLNVEIYSAYDGVEGVRLYKELMMKKKKPDLVVMDLNLSGSKKLKDLIYQMKGRKMDGVRATKKIMKIDPKANIIGFTAFANFEWGKMLKRNGAKEVFGKNIGFDEFAKKVGEFLA